MQRNKGIIIYCVSLVFVLILVMILIKTYEVPAVNEPMCTQYKVNVAPDGTWINREVKCSELEQK